MDFKTDYMYLLIQVKFITDLQEECILQYVRPALNYYLSLRPLFCFFCELLKTGFTVEPMIKTVIVSRENCYDPSCKYKK